MLELTVHMLHQETLFVATTVNLNLPSRAMTLVSFKAVMIQTALAVTVAEVKSSSRTHKAYFPIA
jgi:hypothetical protein